MIRSLPSGEPVIRHDAVTRYLESLAHLCLECARHPHLVPVFIGILSRVPSTLLQLALQQRRRAA